MTKVRDKQARSLAENILIRDYFDNKENGFFVEVGANDPTNHGSQSWHLETKLDWHGVLIEPVPEMAAKCRASRPNSIIFECACIDSDHVNKLTLFIPQSSNNKENLYSKSAIGKNIDDGNYSLHKEISVQARTLNSILQEADVSNVDLLSIDVEGAELEVLLGLNLNRYQPSLILLEDKHLYLIKHKYLKKNGYHLVKRTRQNCWYVPKNAKRPPQSVAEKIRLFKRMYISIWSKKLVFSIRHKTIKPLLQL